MLRPGLCLALILGLNVAATDAETLKFSLPEARALAMQAAINGRPDVALTLTGQLLAENPDDSAAHLAASTALLSMGDWRQAYRGGRTAFRLAETKDAKYQAARVTALAAMGEDRTMLTQFWLRRAGDQANTDVQRRQIQRNFAQVQAKTRLRYRFDFSASPSSNVNGGSDSPYNIIEGVPLVGYLSPGAQALSGFIAQSNLNLSYRLNNASRYKTLLTAGIFAKEVTLSSESRSRAPNVSTSSLASSSLSVGLNHAIALNKPGSVLTFAGGARQVWQGRRQVYMALNGSVAYRFTLSPKIRMSAKLGVETRDYEAGGTGQVNSATLGSTYAFANGSTLSGSLFLSDTTDPRAVFSNQSAYGKITYSLGKPVKSVHLSAGVGAGLTDYRNYRLGFIPVPGGRQDETLFVDLDARFTAIQYAGFSPNLRVRYQETKSNVSRYTTSEVAVSLGIQSNF